MTKRINRNYTTEFKQEALALLAEQGCSVPKASASLEIRGKLLYNWKSKFEAEQLVAILNANERAKLFKCERKLESEVWKKRY